MNCLKSVRIIRDYGTVRLTIVSTFMMMIFFTLFYVMFLHLYPNLHLNHLNPGLFLAVLVLIYPTHKLFHCLPVWLGGYKARLTLGKNSSKLSLLFCDLPEPLPRNRAIAVVVFPGIALTLLAFGAAALEPQFVHYISVFAAVNFGLSVTDWIYVAFLLKAPSHAYIEDSRDGFHILIQTSHKEKKAY